MPKKKNNKTHNNINKWYEIKLYFEKENKGYLFYSPSYSLIKSFENLDKNLHLLNKYNCCRDGVTESGVDPNWQA